MKKLLLSAFALAVAISASAVNFVPQKSKAQCAIPNAKKEFVTNFEHKAPQGKMLEYNGIKNAKTKASQLRDDNLVTPPASATIETDWSLTGNYINNSTPYENSNPISVAFDGNDVYIQGMIFLCEEAWIKGTISGTNVTFANGQYCGSYYGTSIYACGSADGSTLSDITFTYDAEAGTFTLTNFYIENTNTTSLSFYFYSYDIVITKGEIVKPDLVTPPEGLETEDFAFLAYACDSIDDEGYITWQEDITQLDLKIGVDGDDVYIQGLCVYLPEAWVIASLNEDGELIIPTGQYLGAYYDRYDMYLLGYGENGIEDIVFTWSDEYGCFTTDQFVIISGKANAVSWWEIYGYGAIGQFAENVYILGQVNGNDWAANVGYAMTTEDGVTYTADITCAPVDEGDTDGYSFFSFTTMLADDADDWDAIAGYRFGAVSEGDFLVTDDMIGIELSLTDENGQAYKIPDGEYGLSLNFETLKLVITKKAAPGIVGDVTGEGDVDVSDVNAVINIILNKATQDDYPGNADVTGEGDIDVSDVNAIINIILGKN